MGTSPEGSFEFEMQRFMQVGCMSYHCMPCMQQLQTALSVHDIPCQGTPHYPILALPPACPASKAYVNGHGKCGSCTTASMQQLSGPILCNSKEANVTLVMKACVRGSATVHGNFCHICTLSISAQGHIAENKQAKRRRSGHRSSSGDAACRQALLNPYLLPSCQMHCLYDRL